MCFAYPQVFHRTTDISAAAWTAFFRLDGSVNQLTFFCPFCSLFREHYE
jgi:hypothetical protein